MTTFCWLPPLSRPTGCVGRLRLDREVAIIASGRRGCGARKLMSGRAGPMRSGREIGEVMLNATHLRGAALRVRRSSGTRPSPAPTAVCRGARRKRLAVQQHGAAVGPVGAVDQPRQLAAAGADEAAEAEHLAAMQIEAGADAPAAAGVSPRTRQHDLAAGRRRVRLSTASRRPADDRLDKRCARQFGAGRARPPSGRRGRP